jgi:phenylacetate-CoA ligase
MNYRKIALPLVYFMVGNLKFLYYHNLMKNMKLSRDRIIELQNKKLKQLIDHAYYKVPYYKKYFDNNKLMPQDIKNASDLKKLPIMTKQIMKEHINALKATDCKKLLQVTSGGSTGETSIIYKTKYFRELSHAAVMRNLALTGWLPYHKSAWIWGAPYEGHVFENPFMRFADIYLNGRLLLNAFNYSSKIFPLWSEKINKFYPRILYGYSSILSEFADWCLTNTITFPSVKTVVSTSEKLTDRATIEKAFNCKVYDQYGSREILSIATECKNGNLHVSDDTVIVEQINENHLLLTALDSFNYPIIRYKIGDTGKKLYDACPCGLNFSILDLDIARITDNFIRPNGTKVSASAIATMISKLCLNFVMFQIVQKGIDQFVINYIPNRNTGENDKHKFIEVLEKYFGKVKAEFISVESIKREQSGKRLLFKCLIDN